jgi:hypothetical protein
MRRTIASFFGTVFGLIPALFLFYDFHTAQGDELYFAKWLWLILTAQFFLIIFIFAWIWAVWTNRIPGI